MRLRSLVLGATLAFVSVTADAAFASPLDFGSWFQIARMADSDLGMFDGNGNLAPDYTFGTFTSQNQTDDFERPFSVYDGMEILFITGDETIWGQTSYSTLRSLIDAQGGVFTTNIAFDAHIGGSDLTTAGNVLSRAAFSEDPWITLQGDHGTGIFTAMIIWGESDYPSPDHAALKNAHGGVNVFVSTPSAVPLPAALPLLASGLAGIGLMCSWRRRRRTAQRGGGGLGLGLRNLLLVCNVGICFVPTTFARAAVVGELTAVPHVLLVGQSTELTLTLLLSSDPGFSNPQFVSGEAQVDFGDGQTHSFSDFNAGVFREFVVSHSYLSPGGYNVSWSGVGTFSQTDGQQAIISDWILPLGSIGVLVTPAPVPIPAAFPLLASGLSGIGLMGWWRRRRRAHGVLTAHPIGR